MSPCPWLYASYICPTQITGIIGVKAYRCLGNNRLVILFLFIMTAIMWSLEGLHLANYTASRSRYGTAPVRLHMFCDVHADATPRARTGPSTD